MKGTGRGDAGGLPGDLINKENNFGGQKAGWDTFSG
jgi:hypothetical protein